MALAAINFAVQDEAGNALSNVTVEVRKEIAGLPLVQLYSDRDGASALGNPFLAPDGKVVRFYVAGGAYKITASKDALEQIWRHVGIGLAGETDFGGGDSTTQEVTGATATISTSAATAVVNRTAPATTGLTLPDASLRNGQPLRIADYSQSVTDHVITLTPHSVAQKIMRQSTWQLASNAANLASITLHPIIDPDDDANYVWVIAP